MHCISSLSTLATLLYATSFTRVAAAPASTPTTGRICITKAGNGFVGYISHAYNSSSGLYPVTQDAPGDIPALNVSLVHEPAGGNYTLQALNNPYKYVAFLDPANKGNLASNTAAYVYMGGTQSYSSTPISEHNSVTPTSDLLGETAVWTLGPPTPAYPPYLLTPYWNNRNGASEPAQVLFYNPKLDYFGITGDLTAYQGISNNTKNAYPVKFQLC